MFVVRSYWSPGKLQTGLFFKEINPIGLDITNLVISRPKSGNTGGNVKYEV